MKLIKGIAGVVLAIIALYGSLLILTVGFSILSSIPILSSILYYPSDIGIVQVATLNTLPLACGAMVGEQIGGRGARCVFAFLCVALAVILACGMFFGLVTVTIRDIAALVLWGGCSLWLLFGKENLNG